LARPDLFEVPLNLADFWTSVFDSGHEVLMLRLAMNELFHSDLFAV
jgi:hypothetical protein